MKKITKREIFAFIIGILTFFTLETILDWDNNVKAFNDGKNSVLDKK